MKLIYKASDITEAHIVAGLLNSRGIEAHVGGYYLQGGVGDLAAMDFADVLVEDDDYEKARLIVTEYEGTRSQKTKTSRVEDTKIIFKAFMVILALIFIILILYIL